MKGVISVPSLIYSGHVVKGDPFSVSIPVEFYFDNGAEVNVIS